MSDYFNLQKKSGEQSVIDTTPILERIYSVLVGIGDLLAPQPKGRLLNTIQRSVQQTATILLPFNGSRNSLIVRNTASSNIYIGDNNVQATNGFLLQLSDALIMDGFTGEVWAIADGPGATATVIEG